MGAAIWGKQIYNNWKPRRVGVYGASMVGKTTLDRYMTTPGEMEEIPEEMATIGMFAKYPSALLSFRISLVASKPFMTGI